MFIITKPRPLPNIIFSRDGNILSVHLISIPIQIWKKTTILPVNVRDFLTKDAPFLIST